MLRWQKTYGEFFSLFGTSADILGFTPFSINEQELF
jgi:hypothetical protein